MLVERDAVAAETAVDRAWNARLPCFVLSVLFAQPLAPYAVMLHSRLKSGIWLNIKTEPRASGVCTDWTTISFFNNEPHASKRSDATQHLLMLMLLTVRGSAALAGHNLP